MKLAETFKWLMQSYGITYADIGEQIDRSPHTVKQRIETASTFNKYIEEYTQALDVCIEKKVTIQKEARERLNEEI